MLLGRPLRAATSRSGSASPEDRNADSNCDECTTDLTRYGSRPCSLPLMTDLSEGMTRAETEGLIITERFTKRNVNRMFRAPDGPVPHTRCPSDLRIHLQIYGFAANPPGTVSDRVRCRG